MDKQLEYFSMASSPILLIHSEPFTMNVVEFISICKIMYVNVYKQVFIGGCCFALFSRFYRLCCCCCCGQFSLLFRLCLLCPFCRFFHHCYCCCCYFCRHSILVGTIPVGTIPVGSMEHASVGAESVGQESAGQESVEPGSVGPESAGQVLVVQACKREERMTQQLVEGLDMGGRR